MVLLRPVEGREGLQADAGMLPRFLFQRRKLRLRRNPLALRSIVHRQSVGMAPVDELSAPVEGIHAAQIGIQQRFVRDHVAVIGDADGLPMARALGFDILVGGILLRAAGISADGALDAVHGFEHGLNAPEAAPCEIGIFLQWDPPSFPDVYGYFTASLPKGFLTLYFAGPGDLFKSSEFNFFSLPKILEGTSKSLSVLKL